MQKAWALIACACALGCGGGNNNNGDGGGGNCTVIDGLCFATPMHAAQRTACGDVTEYCDAAATKAPNLACLTTPIVPPAGPATVTLTGFVHAFSAGPDSKGVSVAVFDAAQMSAASNPGAVQPIASIAATALDPATQRACDSDAAKGCSIPSTTGCMLPICNDGLNGHTDAQMYCRDAGAGATECSARLRWEARYTLANIPTNKQLVIRTSGPNGAPDMTWATIYTWNVYLSTGDAKCASPSSTDCIDTANAKYQLNVSALSQSDYVNIPTVAGLSGGLPIGSGAIAGEVHDCDNVRVSNLLVQTSPQASRFTYFNGNPIKTLPDSSRLATDQLGLYAALSLAPGQAQVVAAGTLTDGGPLTAFGSFTANVFPDSVAVVNLNGGKPKP